jgi:Flp pilus assembly protein TadD
MKSKANQFYLTFGILAGLVLIRFLPLAVGTKWLWGVGYLTLLPIGYWVGYSLLGGLALALPFLPRAELWGETVAGWFDETFFKSKSKYLHRVFVLLLFGVGFVVFRMPTHFLGDGYTFLSNVGSGIGRWIKWSEGGALVVTMWVQRLIGSGDIPSALLAFQIVSIISGLVTIWFYFLIAERISIDPFKRLLTFTLMVISSSSLLFFGYVESYPILWGPVAGFLYFSLTYALVGKGLSGGLVCLLIAVGLHLQAVMLFPAVLFLLLSRGKGELIYRRFKPLIWAGLALAIMAGSVLFFREYTSNLFFENIFLRPFSGKPISPGYAIFSISHLSDILNLFILVVPMGVLLIALTLQQNRQATSRKSSAYLGILAIGSLLFLIVVDPSLSMPRDWDLFALCLLSPGLWLLNLLPESATFELKRISLSILIIAILSVAPFLIVNLDTHRSVAEIEQIADNNPDKSLGTMSILSTYFNMIGDKKAGDSIGTRMAVTYPEFYQWRSAFKLLESGKREEAFRMFSSVRPDRFSKDFHSFLAAYYLRVERPDSALVHAKLAVQLQPYVDVNYAPLAYAYTLTGETEKALEALRQGYALNDRNRELIMSLALIHYLGGRFDSTLFYAERHHAVDDADPIYHYLAAKGYYGLKNRQAALEHAQLYFQLGSKFSNYRDNMSELLQLLPEFRNAEAGK